MRDTFRKWSKLAPSTLHTESFKPLLPYVRKASQDNHTYKLLNATIMAYIRKHYKHTPIKKVEAYTYKIGDNEVDK